MDYQRHIPAINDVLEHQNAYSAKELFEQYEKAPDKGAFVVALIALLLEENVALLKSQKNST